MDCTNGLKTINKEIILQLRCSYAFVIFRIMPSWPKLQTALFEGMGARERRRPSG